MFLKTVILIYILGLVSGCMQTHSTLSDSLTQGRSPTKLQLTDGEKFHEVVSTLGLSGLDKAKEDQIRAECGGPKIRPDFVPVPILFLIGPVIDFTLDQIDKALEEELKKYVAAYSGSVNSEFYKSTDGEDPVSAWTCFRFSRGVGTKGQEKVVMDLIGQFELTKNKDALKVRPLRLYLAKAKAEGNKIGLSVSLKAHSVWRQENEGKSAKIFDQKLLSEKLDISNEKPVVKYYLEKKWDKYPRLALIPWSTNQSTSASRGDTTLTLTVAEVGAPPYLLEKASKLFNKKKGDLAKLMKDSAAKWLPEK